MCALLLGRCSAFVFYRPIYLQHFINHNIIGHSDNNCPVDVDTRDFFRAGKLLCLLRIHNSSHITLQLQLRFLLPLFLMLPNL